MWKRYFRFIKLKPGRVVTALLGELDFSRDDIPLEKIKALYESDFPYLEITEDGKAEIYGLKPAKEETMEAAEVEIAETAEVETAETAEVETEEIIEAAKPKRGRKSKTRFV
jgi:hypothetical protein